MDFYNIGECETVDEMLLIFCWRCGFRQYMSSKPKRYDIKFCVISDPANHYSYNLIPYLGKEGNKIATNLGANVIKDLAVLMFGSRRNITCNWNLPVWFYLKGCFKTDWLLQELQWQTINICLSSFYLLEREKILARVCFPLK